VSRPTASVSATLSSAKVYLLRILTSNDEHDNLVVVLINRRFCLVAAEILGDLLILVQAR
jgi:hypothetical protein